MEWISEHLCRIFQTEDRKPYEKKADQILKKYYPQIKGKNLAEILDESENATSFQKLGNLLNHMEVSLLYQSAVHGQDHVERVSVLTWLLMERMGISGRKWELILMMAMYHDVGRQDDSEDPRHGRLGAERLKGKLPGLTPKEEQLLLAVIEAHSLLDSEAEIVYGNHFGDQRTWMEVYLQALRILKDADALDRFRLNPYSLDIKYLRIPESEALVRAACELSLYAHSNGQKATEVWNEQQR